MRIPVAPSSLPSSPSSPWWVCGYGIDWLTSTAPVPAESEQLWKLGCVVLSEESQRGEETAAHRQQGYQGFKAGQAILGTRADGVLLQVSGEVARRHWAAVLTAARNVSRVDVQVTVENSSPDPYLTERALHEVEAHGKERGRPPTHQRIQGSGGGDTLYLGAPTSDRRCRLYDKGVEEDRYQPGYRWRYECQFRRKLAGAVRDVLLTAENPDDAMRSIVLQSYRRLGLEPLFSADTAVAISTVRRWSSVEAKLQWIRTQVRPTIDFLRAAGKLDEVRGALGL